jgi:hypothetical protein
MVVPLFIGRSAPSMLWNTPLGQEKYILLCTQKIPKR